MVRQEPGEPYRRISASEAKELIDANNEILVVDVRRPDEWESGHIRGAVHIPIDELMDRVTELPDNKIFLFVCASGVRSGLACEIAAATGHEIDNLYNIEDGTPGWIEQNYPTDYGE